MKILFIFLSSILGLAYIAESQSCDAYSDEGDCVSLSGGSCKWVNGVCRCASEVQLDILFGIDTSGSIGYDGFQIQKQFIRTLVNQGINNGSRIGFYLFANKSNASKEIQYWETDQLLNYVDGIYWTKGWTNTPQLINDSLVEFSSTYDSDRQQIFMIITDGNPCLPSGCPQSVCGYASQIKTAGIRTVIIGVGDGLITDYVQCLTLSDDDFIYVDAFSTAAFNSIMGSLSGILCPESREFKVTECKAEKKPSSWNARLPRFIEIYNFGIDFNISDIQMTGLITMDLYNGIGALVTQGQYVVFYDAQDAPYVSNGYDTGSTPSCHLCGDACDLTSCSGAGETLYYDYCWCANSVYIACGNADGYDECESNVADTGAENGCQVCTFNDGYSRSDWNIVISDAADVIDSVYYDADTWIETDDGYSYELLGKGYDNDYGDNWGQTCNILGTPGSDPAASCSESCSTDNGCVGGSSYCDSDSGLCVCDTTTGYYPQCTSSTSCVKCLLVPTSENCTVTWLKNGTERYAMYSWTDSNRDGDTQYQLSYFDGSSSSGEITTATTNGELAYRVDNYYSANTSYGGFVQTVISQCFASNISSDEVCYSYTSTATLCTVLTASPTLSPTAAPTAPPTPAPSPNPTMSPTWQCPWYYWQNDDVCNPDTDEGYGGNRCYCTDNVNRACCLDDPTWLSGEVDETRTHRTDYDCREDVEMEDPEERWEGESESGYADGYLLTVGNHYFQIGITPENYPCKMDVYWELVFDSMNCDYSDRRRNLLDTDTEESICDSSSTALYNAGLRVNITSGHLTIWSADDVNNATVTITVESIDCAEAWALKTNSTNADAEDGNYDCFDGAAISGSLNIVNATSSCQPDCYDGRVYPMQIPVWYNYAAAVVVVPGEESPLPAWLWWLIAAMVVFLALLALLVYKYWWKNKATGAALSATQADLDAAVHENEAGWANDLSPNAVGFNPLATGFNPNAPAGAANPNAPPNGGGGGPQFVRPNVEKPVFRMEFGQKMGNMN